MKVDLFIPCFIDQFFPQTGMNMVKVLEACGCEVHYNTDQTCCGQLALNGGFWKEAKDVGGKFLNDFKGDDYIVSPSGSCVGYVRNYYHKLFENTTRHNDVKNVKRRTYEFTEFLVDVVKATKFGATLEGIATYHDACGALRECGIKSGPRKLLKQVKGLKLKEMHDVETCCGFGGTFSTKFEPISVAMAEQKVEHALKTKANYIISTDLSCLMHLEGYIKKRKYPIKTMHIADVLASGL